MNQHLTNLFRKLFKIRLWIAAIIFTFYLGNALFKIAAQDRQHDFTTYYFGVKAFTLGLNPYETSVLSSIANKNIHLPFLYPPISLSIMRFFVLFDYNTASNIFLFLKIIFLILLIFVWGKYFCKDTTEQALMLLFAAFSFHETVIRDLNAGNISIFEQLFLWMGIFALMKARYFAFTLFMIAGCIFKPLTLGLLIPLAFVSGIRKRSVFIIVLFGYICIQGLTMLYDPGLFQEFLKHASLPDERGFINPSSLAISREIVDLFPVFQNVQATFVSFSLYFIFVLVVLSLGIIVLRKLDTHSGMMCVLLIFALIAPRFKDYSYILLIIPSIFCITQLSVSKSLRIITIIITCTHFVAHQSFIAAFWLFSIFVYSNLSIPLFSYSQRKAAHE